MLLLKMSRWICFNKHVIQNLCNLFHFISKKEILSKNFAWGGREIVTLNHWQVLISKTQFAVNTFFHRESVGQKNPSSLNFIGCSVNSLFMVTHTWLYISIKQIICN